MALSPALADRINFPIIAAPMFIVSGLRLVAAQCKAGIVGSFPALNARTHEQFRDWLAELDATLAQQAAEAPGASTLFAVNLIVHKSNPRLERDVEACVERKVPVIITSLGLRQDVIEAIHSYGGLVLHDVINVRFARKAVDAGVDGLIAVAAGAGGHAGTVSPFALIEEIRAWYDGTLALSGAISTGRGILAAQALGADLAYIGSAFIPTREANAEDGYKQMIVEGSSADIVYTPLFSGVHANYLKASIRAAGLDPDTLPRDRPEIVHDGQQEKKAWKDIWSAGHGIGGSVAIESTAGLVNRLRREYDEARGRLVLAGGSK